MLRSIDVKSAIIGGLLVAMILCLVGAVPFVLEEYGRFQIETNDSHAFILDSATGQVWSSMFLNPQVGIYTSPDPNFLAPKISYADSL